MSNPLLTCYEACGISELLLRHEGLSLRSSTGKATVVRGRLRFVAVQHGFHNIEDEYEIELKIPVDYPKSPPLAKELGKRVSKDFHTFLDGTLCLASPLRLQVALRQKISLLDFVERFVIGFLYGHSHLQRFGVLPSGELAHGSKGLIDDYEAQFPVRGRKQCRELIRLASIKKRVANKRPCFCGSGNRLGACHNRAVNRLRGLAGRRWCTEHFKQL